MRLLRTPAGRTAAGRYVAAHEALWRNGAEEKAAGIDHESPEYLRLNRAAWESSLSPDLPGWYQDYLAWRLARRLLREGVDIY
jgi:hypothetical protein